MKIIKRSGTEVRFDIKKIIDAIEKANSEVEDCKQLSLDDVKECAKAVETKCKAKGRILTVEEVQDLVENEKDIRFIKKIDNLFNKLVLDRPYEVLVDRL